MSDFLPIKKCGLTEIVKMNHLTWVKQFFFGLPKTAFRLCFVHINLMYTKLFDYVRFLNVHLKQPKFMWIIISTRWQWNVFYPKQFASTVSDCRDTKAAARPFIGDVSQTLPEPLRSAGVGIYYIYFRPTSVYFPHVGTSRLIHLFVLSCHICSLILVKKGLLGKFMFWFLASECACKCISFNKNLNQVFCGGLLGAKHPCLWSWIWILNILNSFPLVLFIFLTPQYSFTLFLLDYYFSFFA